MGPVVIVALVLGGIGLLLIFWVIGMYNGLVRLRNQMKNAWSQIDVQLKRRCDLIPNLIETVKGYMTHERETLEAVTRMRSQAMGATNVDDRIRAEAGLSGALGRLMVVVEQYPDLKANQNFLSLQEELSSTENKISFSRQFYNDGVMGYNTKIEVFPDNIIAGMFQFKRGAFFEIEDKAQREAPKVKF